MHFSFYYNLPGTVYTIYNQRKNCCADELAGILTDKAGRKKTITKNTAINRMFNNQCPETQEHQWKMYETAAFYWLTVNKPNSGIRHTTDIGRHKFTGNSIIHKVHKSEQWYQGTVINRLVWRLEGLVVIKLGQVSCVLTPRYSSPAWLDTTWLSRLWKATISCKQKVPGRCRLS